MRNVLNTGKKGQARNYFAIIIFLFSFGLATIFGYYITSTYISELSSTPIWTADMNETADGFLTSIRILDYVFILFLIVLIIGTAFTSRRLSATPIGFVVTLIMAAFYGYISYFFNYIFAQIVSTGLLTATLLFFPRTILICTNLHWIMLILIVIGSITLYGKREQGQEQLLT